MAMCDLKEEGREGSEMIHRKQMINHSPSFDTRNKPVPVIWIEKGEDD